MIGDKRDQLVMSAAGRRRIKIQSSEQDFQRAVENLKNEKSTSGAQSVDGLSSERSVMIARGAAGAS
jgi:hypothetical protein